MSLITPVNATKTFAQIMGANILESSSSSATSTSAGTTVSASAGTTVSSSAGTTASIQSTETTAIPIGMSNISNGQAPLHIINDAKETKETKPQSPPQRKTVKFKINDCRMNKETICNPIHLRLRKDAKSRLAMLRFDIIDMINGAAYRNAPAEFKRSHKLTAPTVSVKVPTRGTAQAYPCNFGLACRSLYSAKGFCKFKHSYSTEIIAAIMRAIAYIDTDDTKEEPQENTENNHDDEELSGLDEFWSSDRAHNRILGVEDSSKFTGRTSEYNTYDNKGFVIASSSPLTEAKLYEFFRLICKFYEGNESITQIGDPHNETHCAYGGGCFHAMREHNASIGGKCHFQHHNDQSLLTLILKQFVKLDTTWYTDTRKKKATTTEPAFTDVNQFGDLSRTPSPHSENEEEDA